MDNPNIINDIKEDSMSEEEEKDNLTETNSETDTEESDCTQDDIDDTSDFYFSRDKTIQWSKEPPINTTKIKEKTKISSGVTGFAQGAKSPIESWQMFFPDATIDEIVKYTNIFIANIRKDYSRERDACDTNQSEIKAVLGLLYLAGIMKQSHQNLADLWAKDGTGVEYFHATISLKRFRFLLYSLHFENIYDEEKNEDVLAPIQKFFNNYTIRCNQHFTVGENIAIGKLYEPFKGKCEFKKLINKKLSKHGIYFYVLVDAKLCYISNMKIDTDLINDSNIIKKLTEPLSNSFRNITYNQEFTSLELVDDLLNTQKLQSVGNIKRNKKEIPSKFVKQTDNTLFGYYKNYTLISHLSDSNKAQLYLSSMPHTTNLETNKKCEEVSFYNYTRKSVKSLQELYNNFSVTRTTSRWPLAIFFFMLKSSGINSQILLQSNLKTKLNRRDFLITLTKSLTADYLKMRATADNLPQYLKIRKRQLAGVHEEEVVRKHQGGHGRCTFCSWKKNRKTTTVCVKCSKYICREHTTSTCIDCTEHSNGYESE